MSLDDERVDVWAREAFGVEPPEPSPEPVVAEDADEAIQEEAMFHSWMRDGFGVELPESPTAEPAPPEDRR
jgi:hypothetical protein